MVFIGFGGGSSLGINKMALGNKHAFWQALVFTIVVFGIGLLMGFFLESAYSNKVFYKTVDSEVNILDNQLRERIVGQLGISCETAKKSLFDFADKIYNEANQLESEDTDGRLTDITILHKRYDLLRTLLFIESNDLKSRCGSEFKSVVYLYEYLSEDLEVQGKQAFYSKLLFDLKVKYSEDVILIPIAVDTGLSSVDILSEANSLDSYPVILLDSGEVIDSIITLEELESKVFQ